MIPIYLNKGEEASISMLDPLPEASTKYIAIPTDFPTVPSTYKSLESDAISLQESLLKSRPNNFAMIATTLTAALRCQQENASLNQDMDRRVRYFETQFDTRGFVCNVLTSLTQSHLNDPNTEIKELSSK